MLFNWVFFHRLVEHSKVLLVKIKKWYREPFAKIQNRLVNWDLCRLFGANPAVGDEARKGFPLTAIRETPTSAGSAILKQALTTCFLEDWIWTPASFLFHQYGQAWEVILSGLYRVVVGAFEESRPFSKRAVKYWNRLPLLLLLLLPLIQSSANLIRRGRNCLHRLCYAHS